MLCCTAEKGAILVLHRVVKRKGGQFYMAGDNQTEVEGRWKRPDQRDFDRICAEWTSYQREKSGLCDLVRIVADVSAGERDILVIYCMGAPAA